MFAVGATLPLALLIVFSWLLPESPKYMAKHRRLYSRLAESLNQLLKEKRFDGSEEFFVSEAGKRSANWLATILNDDFRARTVLIWIAFTANSFVLYIFTGQIPLLLDSAHLSTNASSMALQYFSFGAIIGALGGAMLIGSFGSKRSGTLLAAAGSIASASIAFVLAAKETSTIPLFALCLVAGASVNGIQALLYAVGTHSYPTDVRGSAVGMAQTTSRVGAVVSPMVAAYYFHMDPMPSVSAFFLFMATVVVITVVSYFFIPSHIPRNTHRG
jgi:AAHS family 4-hydroxybenzoate transporter-like MFS transporter